MSDTMIRTAVETYLKTVAAGSAADIAALYAVDGTLEDPVGSAPVSGRAAIEQFYRPLESSDVTTELIHLRCAADTAAFHFRVITTAGGRTYTVEPIDVMTFDADGAITSMRAVWAPSDMIVG